MEIILRLLSELRFVLIAICGICCAAFLFAGLGSLRDLRRAVFRLERSAIISRVLSSWLKAGLCLIIAAVIWAVTGIAPRSTATASQNPLSVTPTILVSTVEPAALPTADLSNAPVVMTTAPIEATAAAVAALNPTAAIATADTTLANQSITPTIATSVSSVPSATVVLPTLPPIATPVVSQPAATAPAPISPAVQTKTPAQTPVAALPTLAPIAAPLPTQTPPPTEVPVAAATPESFFVDCPNPDVQISNPVAGETVSGAYAIRGTAGFEVGGKYKVEILRPNIEGWAFLWENYNNVKGGVLMPNFNSGLFPPGVYVLRVMLVDSAGQETGNSCRVAIRIAG